MLRLHVWDTESEEPHGNSDDVCSSGDRGDSAFSDGVQHGETDRVVWAAGGFLSKMAGLSDRVANKTKSVYAAAGVSFFLSHRSERFGGWRIPHNPA